MMFKRFMSLMLACMLLMTAMPGVYSLAAENEDGTLSSDDVASDVDDEELAEGAPEVAEVINGIVTFDDNVLPVPVGPQYQDKTLADFNKKSPALYTARIKEHASGWSERKIYTERVFNTKSSTPKVDVLYVDPLWVIVRWKGEIAYVKRRLISEVTPVDPETTPPYGVQKHQYVAVTGDTAEVRVSMSHEDNSWAILKPGTTLSIWKFEGEWAIVNYWRSYGYIHVSDLAELRMVSPTDVPLSDDTPIAAYTSYYKVNDTDAIQNRMYNIDLGIQRMSIVLQPGESLDANDTMGPYTLANGYLEAGALSGGTTILAPGGGTCQVSSTLYNVLLQLPGIRITYRRAHGNNGAPYLPHGVDAAVGSKSLNLTFRNDYDFPIRLEGHTNYDGALCWLVYREDGYAASTGITK